MRRGLRADGKTLDFFLKRFIIVFMKIIIIGAGKVGVTLIQCLVSEGHDVLFIDRDGKRVSEVANRFAANGICSVGLSRDTLKEAGVSSADFVISSTSQDEVNILCSVLAKKLGAKRTIARVRDPQYYKELENLRTELGLDLIFNPDRRAAADIAEVLNFPSARSVESFADGKAAMAEFDIKKGNPVAGKTLKAISSEFGFGVLFGMIRRGEDVFIPRGDFTLKEGDAAYVIATEAQIAAFCKKTKTFKPRAKTVFIVGGGKIGFYLAQMLTERGASVKIVEKDKARCEFLSENLDYVTVINGDGTDLNVLNEEDIKSADAVVTLTGMDEENVIISLYAKQKKVEKVVTKVNRDSVSEMVKTLGLDTVISPRNSIANHILRFVRSHFSEKDGGINALYKLPGKAEASEFTVTESFPFVGKPLSSYTIRRDVLIGGIVREGGFVVPKGDTSLLKGDRVIVVSATKKINALEGILK